MKTNRTFFIALLLAVFGWLAYFSQGRIERLRRDSGDLGELLYFPSARFTKAAACGYDNVAGDWIWLQIIQYYGKHELSDNQYRYLGGMFNVLATLTPSFIHGYTFGALLLSTNGNDLAGAYRLLDRGMADNPGNWEIPFTKGFVDYVFVKDYREAGRWFFVASRLPDAPEMAGRFAAIAMQKGQDLMTSRQLWLEIYDKTRNQTEREIAKFYIDSIDRELIARELDRRAEILRQRTGRPIMGLQDLVDSGLISRIPADPLDGKFFWNGQKGKAEAAGGRKLH